MESNPSWSLRFRRMLIPGAIFLVLLLIAGIRFGRLYEKTREGTTIGRLNELRQAILLYYQDHNGVFPRELNLNGPFGRYLSKIPSVEPLHPSDGTGSPAGDQVVYGTGIPEGYSQGWYYNYESGQIYVNSVGKDSRGLAYSAY